ncbi:MAG: Smr/MutS family protein [Betaproteobacteria bacterium]|nr:Smr/MutS family protein [Betaproteobacteria bacterium]
MSRRKGHPAFSALGALRRKKTEGAAAAKASDSARDEIPVRNEATKPEIASMAERDAALWQDAVRDVLPRINDRVALFPRPLPPLARQRELAEARALAESLEDMTGLDAALEGEEEDVFLAPGVAQKTLSDLRRGRWVIQAELDLHGATREEARLLLNDFLEECKKRGLRCLRVIHGKGLSSPGRQPVLRPLVRQWLSRHAMILAFCPARPCDGGSGALLILLRSEARHSQKQSA